MTERGLVRGRSDSSNLHGDSWQPSTATSTPLSMSAQMTSSGGSERLDTEVPSPPLAVISTRVKSAGALENCANFETATVKYAYETTTLSRLLKAIGERLRGRKALSIALVVHGSPGCFKVCSQKTVTCITLREDEELRKFFETLVSTYLNSRSLYTRIDILNCPVMQSPEGEQLIADMKQLLGVPVFAYSDIRGAQITEAGSDESGRHSRIGTLYFDSEKLKDWAASLQQTMALFERIRTVGKGAYGAAVLYRKKDDGSHVILKEINLMELTKTERYSAMNEAQILSRLDHPNIISYYDNFEEDGVLMIEMEYADGGTLAQFLQKQVNQNKPLPEKDVVTMFSQMVDALKYLHDHNILHRDLKTANVFRTKEGIVKLGDFGISKILSATSPEANTVLGTPYYISPEICEGKHYDAKSDIWSLGCILYEMVCLQKTFEGTNLPVLVHKIVEVSFAPVRGDYSDGLKQLISEMLQKNPEERPSAKDIYMNSLPLLTSMFTPRDEEEEEGEETEDAAKTHTKSFLYYLDGVSLLLHHVPATFQTKLDHIAVGYSHTLALADEGMVFSWGVGSKGQLGHGDRETKRSPQLVESIKGKQIVRVECGGEFSVLVTDNGILMTCGCGHHGVQGHRDDTSDCLKPKLVEDLITHDVIQVGCGESHIAVVTSENKVLMWGAGQHGRLGTGGEEDRDHPVEVVVCSPGSKMHEVIRNIKCGVDGTMFLTDTGRLFACGNNQDNKLGLNRRETFIMQMRKILNKERQLQVMSMAVPTPLKELGKHRVVDMSLGPTHSTVLAELGHVFTFGRNSEGQLCAGNTLPQYIPVHVRNHVSKPTMVTSSELCTIVTTEDNSFLVWGSRPVIKTPLGEIFEQEDPPNKQQPKNCGSIETTDNVFVSDANVSHDPGTPNRKCISTHTSHSSVPLSPPTSDTLQNFDNQTPGPSSGEGSPAKYSSIDSISMASSPQKNFVTETPFKSSPRMVGSRSRNPSLNFSEVPHTLVPCSECCQYLKALSDVLYKSLDSSSQGRKMLKRESISGTQLGISHRRGASTSSSSVQTTGNAGKDTGVILHPTSMDLVGKSGILNLLSVEGITEAKLEGLSCYGSNVLVLIQAQVVEGSSVEGEGEGRRSRIGCKELPTFRIGRRIAQRALRRRNSVTPSPFHPPPSLHSTLPPPLHPPVSPPPHPPPTLTEETSVADDTMEDTWIKEIYEDAIRDNEGLDKRPSVEKSPTHIDTGGGHDVEALSKQNHASVSRTLEGEGIEENEVTPRFSVEDIEDKEGSFTKTEIPEKNRHNIDSVNKSLIQSANKARPQQATRTIKQASSTSYIAEPPVLAKNPLNVKRVSSSNDVARVTSALKPGGHAGISTVGRGGRPGKIDVGGPSGRRLSDNDVIGRGYGVGRGRGGRDDGTGKQGRVSIPSGEIHLPGQRGSKAPPPILSEADVKAMPPLRQISGSSVSQPHDNGRRERDEAAPKGPTFKVRQSTKHHSILESSPYAEPVPRIVRPGSKHFAQGKSRAPSSTKHGPSQRTLEEKEKKAQEQKEVEAAQQLQESRQREEEMKEHIQQLQTQLQQQQSQIESNQNAMKDLQQKLLELQQERPPTAVPPQAVTTTDASSSPKQSKRRRFGIIGSRSRRRDSDASSSTEGERQTKSRVCVVM